ncbi:MAG: hypothetical protein AB7F41_17235 [Methylocystis sp.]|uniref:hypothetical protein n=1 Tax=Methylocystis sp. TaxID=1911079 RepID=UPI003D13B1DC
MTSMAHAGALALLAAPAWAGEWDVGASVAGELRLFPGDPLYPAQLDAVQPSATIEPDIRWQSVDRRHQAVVIPFVRVDAQDAARTHGDIREAYYRYSGDHWSVLVGLAKVFWGKAESRHLVDIINQDDAVEDIDGEDKLGQPMIQASLRGDWGRVEFFVLPGFRERTFPGEAGRLRTDPPVSKEREIFEAPAGRAHVDFAARYSHYVGDVDIGLSVFRGTSREPRFLVEPGGSEFIPIYDQITQFGADIQYTKGAWLWKFEGAVRDGRGDTFFASVAGFEYTLYQVLGSADLGLLAEHLYDGRDEDIAPFAGGFASAAPLTPFDNDVFIGARLAFNDAQDASLLAGAVIDLADATTAMSIEAERRIGANWTIEIESRLFFNADAANPFAFFRRDDFATLRLTRYF